MPDHVPAANAEIYWNDGERDLPDRIVVLDDRTGSNPFTGQTRRDVEGRENSAGSLTAGWMEGAGGHESTPEGLFAGQFVDRATERTAIRAGLVALGQIAECEWARRMLATLEELERGRA